MNKGDLDVRMKRYEHTYRYHLLDKTPVIIRIDGKAFHTFTKGFMKPFDSILMEAMHRTTQELCRKIQGCKMGYTQSDEISLLLIDYDKLTTDAWFDNNIQKMASISASIATLTFHNIFNELVRKNIDRMISNNQTLQGERISLTFLRENGFDDAGKYIEHIKKVYNKEAYFDSRVYNLPKEEVCNYFIWRQQDASRNSVQMVGRANFSHKELDKKSSNEIQEMLFQEKGINWDKLPVAQKRGICTNKVKTIIAANGPSGIVNCERRQWMVDENIPIFSKDKDYINRYVFLENTINE